MAAGSGQDGSGRGPDAATDIAALFRSAIEHQRANRLDLAAGLYRRVLTSRPDFAPAWNNLGVALRALGRIEAAVVCLRRGLALDSCDAGAWTNLGNALRAVGKYEEARNSHLRSLELAPQSGQAMYNLALAYRDLGDTEEAMRCFARAEELGFRQVELYWDRALTHLLMGDLERGFEEYEWRWKLPEHPPRFVDRPLWDGAGFAGGRLLVHAEQGYGDAIQFMRYLPMAAARGGTVLFECPAPLVRLVRASPDLAAVRVVPAGAPLPRFDCHIPLLSLARVLRTGTEPVPNRVPYLTAPRAEGFRLPRTLFKVGLVWAGKPSHRNDRNRSIPFRALLPLLDLPRVCFVALQKGEAAEDIHALGAEALIHSIGPRLRDFADTAAVIARLDLVVTADTAVAHLAGALGRPVWTLLPRSPDWRWQLDREDSPWYPTMRLFRQERPGDWPEVVTRVRAALAARVEAAEQDVKA